MCFCCSSVSMADSSTNPSESGPDPTAGGDAVNTEAPILRNSPSIGKFFVL